MAATNPLIIENTVLLGLLHNTALTEAFPFLQVAKQSLAPKRGGGGCGTCSAKKGGGGIDYNHLKTIIAGLDANAKAKFKQITGASEVKIIFRSAGQIRTVQF